MLVAQRRSPGADAAWNGTFMPMRSAFAATEDRRRSTGERHQTLHALLDDPQHPAALPIPRAQRPEQQHFEAEIFLAVCKLGGQCEHPLGIVRVRPEPDRLTIRLADDPRIVAYWAQFLLPAASGDARSADTDPRDQIIGVAGLRWHREAGRILLLRPRMPVRILLTGFDPAVWEREAASLREAGYPLLDEAGWTSIEQDAYRRAAASRPDVFSLLSSLLRRIRATAGPGPVNSTDAWPTHGGIRLETTDGPPCPELIRLLATGPTALGWNVEYERCTCGCDDRSSGCTVEFCDPVTGTGIHYSNCSWGRTRPPAPHRATPAPAGPRAADLRGAGR